MLGRACTLNPPAGNPSGRHSILGLLPLNMRRERTWRHTYIFILLALFITVTSSLEDFEPHEDCTEEGYFRCNSGKCISKSFVCDGEVDCGHGDTSDENSCHLLYTLPSVPCPSTEYQCTDRLCIPAQWVCDGESDCADGSDEIHGCENHVCSPTDFQCKSKSCIPREWECDGSRDCPDNSDEDHCVAKPINIGDCDLHDGLFLCRDEEQCIKLNSVCNNHADCVDGSDEGGHCNGPDPCHNVTCPASETCVTLPEGPKCIQLCHMGYKFKHGICEDVNECDNFGQCDQVCINTIGGYNCTCVDGYTWRPTVKACKADGGEAMMVFSSNDEIRVIFLTSRAYFPVAIGLPHASGVAYDGNHIYWATLADGEETIVQSDEQGLHERIIVTSGIGTPEDLAIDWITGTLYFTDSKYRHIGVCSNDGLICTVLHNKDIDKPRAIALHPSEGLMYWTDWGIRPMIGQCGMDGSHVLDFVTENIHWPNGLSIDHGANRLYWVDAKEGTIECIKLDGTDRRKIPATTVRHPFSIEIFENRIFWSDWDTSQIQTCNKFTGHDCQVFVREREHKIYGIHIFHPSLLKPEVANPCYEAHCSDLCLLAPKNRFGVLQYNCTCPHHKKLSKDGRNCVEDSVLDLMIVGAGQILAKVEHKKFGGFETSIMKIHHLRKIGALAYDPFSEKIIVSDLIMKSIITYDVKKNETETLLENVGRIVGMEFDYYGNNLYWVDEEKKTIEVMNLDHKYKKTLLRDFGDETPSDIALVLEAGFMFIAFHSNHGSHIDRISMDGRPSTRSHVVETELIGPLSLFYDSTLGRLFWADRNAGSIMTTDSEGLDRHGFFDMDSAPLDVATLDEDVFWVTYGSNKIFWANKFNSHQYQKEFVVDGIKDTDHIRIIGVHQHPVLNNSDTCKVANCSHLCLLSLHNVVCGCPDGMELEFNKETCKTQLICKEDEYKCSTGECISRSFRCNGRHDCQKGDDEEHCTIACPQGHFPCADGRQCVPHAARCNKRLDCIDSSDEHNCDTEGCSDSEFHCGSGECIPLINHCDIGTECMDGSDELNCNEAEAVCLETDFRCDSGNCIPSSWHCDNLIDCTDGSDEGEHCKKKESCKGFSCGNGHCISKELQCNGEDDCEDNTDEEHCQAGSTQSSTARSNSSLCAFTCPSDPTTCYPLSVKCDGKVDCPRREDEQSCANCNEEQFACASGRCIPKDWECDNVNDCKDNSDEIHCVNMSVQVVGRNHDEGKNCDGFLCKEGGACLPLHKLCDRHPDCPDGADERGLCGSQRCEAAGCQHDCHERPEGPKCACKPGYYLAGDGRSCWDIDECEKMSSCSQLCLNNIGSYKCSCVQPGYHLRSDRISCKAKGGEMKYYYATEKLIKLKAQSLQKTDLIYKSNYNLGIKGMDIDMKNMTLYWSSEISGNLVKMSLLNIADVTEITNLVRPTKIGFDWITGNIYILENSNRIRACSFVLMKCTLIYKSEKDIVIDTLAVDPYNRLIFWTETTKYMMQQLKSVLKKASMSGENIVNLIELNEVLIGDIVADSIHELIFWSDMREKDIHRCDYHGKVPQFVVKSQNPPTNLMLFEDYLYWLNGPGETVAIMDDFAGTLTKFGVYGLSYMKYEQIRLLPRGSTSHVGAVLLGHTALQRPGHNPCTHSHCQEFCIPVANNSICFCEDGLKVKPKYKCPETSSSGVVFKVSKPSTHETVESSWAWFWWLVALVLVGGMTYLAYVYFTRYYRRAKIGRSVSVFFPVATEPEPNSRTALAPGQHQYENPIFTVVP